jgi:hypothetical protein
MFVVEESGGNKPHSLHETAFMRELESKLYRAMFYIEKQKERKFLGSLS